MKRRTVWGILAITALLVVSSIVVATENPSIKTEFKRGFSLEKGYGFYIPSGSTVYYHRGSTKVFDSNMKLLIEIKDVEVPKLPTPAGYSLPATRIFQVPSGSLIKKEGNTTIILKEGKRLLTVVGTENAPSFEGWIEWAEKWNIAGLDRFWGYWNVPSSPPDPDPNAIDFLFTGIQPGMGYLIIQPVLEWNWGGSGRWTAAAWYASDIGVRSTPINVNVGETIYGDMMYTYYNVQPYNSWIIYIRDENTGSSTSLSTNTLGTSNLGAFVTLEDSGVNSNSDLPGDTHFRNMRLLYKSNPLSFNWVEKYGDLLEGLDVVLYPGDNSKVDLNTAN